jgi:hypothetical protein
MLSRALTLATVTLLIGCLAADQAQAQATNLEAGKSPSQIFAGTCNACHKSPRGLLKTVPAGSLQGFLRQHYTTSPEMAGVLASFLVSNGAADTRYSGNQPKGAKEGTKEGAGPKEAKQEPKPNGPPEQLDRFGRRQRLAPSAQEAAKPDTEQRQAAKPEADGLPPQAEPGRPGHNKRLVRPGEAPEGAKPGAEGQVPVEAEGDHGPDGRKLSAKQRLSKRGKPGAEESPKAEEAPAGEVPKGETAVKEESKPSTDAKPESAKSETAKVEPGRGSAEPAATRPDPVPPVTPAASPATVPAISASVTGKPEPSAAPSEPASQPPPPTVTASTPPPAVAPAGPPAPPISQ